MEDIEKEIENIIEVHYPKGCYEWECADCNLKYDSQFYNVLVMQKRKYAKSL